MLTLTAVPISLAMPMVRVSLCHVNARIVVGECVLGSECGLLTDAERGAEKQVGAAPCNQLQIVMMIQLLFRFGTQLRLLFARGPTRAAFLCWKEVREGTSSKPSLYKHHNFAERMA